MATAEITSDPLVHCSIWLKVNKVKQVFCLVFPFSAEHHLNYSNYTVAAGYGRGSHHEI